MTPRRRIKHERFLTRLSPKEINWAARILITILTGKR